MSLRWEAVGKQFLAAGVVEQLYADTERGRYTIWRRARERTWSAKLMKGQRRVYFVENLPSSAAAGEKCQDWEAGTHNFLPQAAAAERWYAAELHALIAAGFTVQGDCVIVESPSEAKRLLELVRDQPRRMESEDR